MQLSLYRTATDVSVSAAARSLPHGGGSAGRRLAGHGRRSNLELLSHGVGISVLCRRGTRDEFNSDWSLSITSSLGTLFSSPLRHVRSPRPRTSRLPLSSRNSMSYSFSLFPRSPFLLFVSSPRLSEPTRSRLFPLRFLCPFSPSPPSSCLVFVYEFPTFPVVFVVPPKHLV